MANPTQQFDPDQVRMTIGDHLEELRRRLILGLVGLVPAIIICMIFGQQVLNILCRPLISALQKSDVSPQIFTNQPADAFMVYMKVCVIAAMCLAGPWIVYQLWLFVRTGLYETERHYVTKYIPLSIVLLIAGMVFVYYVVLPFTLYFFIGFTTQIPLNLPTVAVPANTTPTTQPSFIEARTSDPEKPSNFRIWFDRSQGRLKMFVDGRIRIIPFGPNNLVSPHFTLPDYLDLVLQLLVTFALAFQLPLVVLALVRIGIVPVESLKRWRRYVYFALAALAAMLAPGDVVTATIALMLPLILLYELGIYLARVGPAEKTSPETSGN